MLELDNIGSNFILFIQQKNKWDSPSAFYKIKDSITTNATIPGIPKKPETAEVAKLIGTCKSKVEPKAFKKNNNSAPIIIFTNPCPIKRTGFIGAPTKSKSNMIPPIIAIIIFGSISNTPLR